MSQPLPSSPRAPGTPLTLVRPEATPEAGVSRQDGLDVLRALAILAVLCFHSPEGVYRALPEAVRSAFTFGWVGVDLFFVLSGYLIGRQVFAARTEAPLGTQLREFWVKRWTRTLPLYFVVLGTYAFLKPRLFGAPFVGGGWHFALFLQNYFPLRDFVQSWSLCVEEHFYLVLPLLAFGLRGRTWPAAVWLVPVGLSVVGRALVQPGIPEGTGVLDLPFYLQWPTHLHLDGLALGVFLARTAPTWRAWSVGRKRACAGAGVAVFAATLALCGPWLVGPAALWMFTGLAVGFSLLLVGVESVRLPPWARRAVYAVAVTSYGAYLWHGLVVRVFDRAHLSLGPWPVDLALFMAVTLAVAWVTYRAVEKPGLRLRDWLLGARGR